MKLVNVKLDDELGKKVEIVAKTRRTTITEVVREAVSKDIEAIWRDVQFQQKAKETLDAERALLG